MSSPPSDHHTVLAAEEPVADAIQPDKSAGHHRRSKSMPEQLQQSADVIVESVAAPPSPLPEITIEPLGSPSVERSSSAAKHWKVVSTALQATHHLMQAVQRGAAVPRSRAQSESIGLEAGAILSWFV